MMMLIRRNILFLLFILSLVGIAAFLNQAWLFDPFGWVDHWAYVGISLYFEKYKVLFNNHPAIELLPVTLPSAFLYSLFDPLTAKIIKDMAFAVTLLLAIFYSVKAFFGSVCAFMVATFSVGYEYLLSTFGSDYTDSAVATYYGIALLFCILASKEKGKFEYLYLSISGFFYGLMLYSAILSIIYLPVIIAMYGLIKLSKTPMKSIWRDLQRSGFSFLTGFFVTTICLCAFHSSYSNSIYFSSNIRKLLHFTGGGYARPPFQEWLPNASWLILPGSIFLAAVAFIVCGVFSRNAKAHSVQDIKYINAVLAAVIISGCFNLFVDIVIHQWSLQVLYFNQTIPVYMLGLGALLHACKTKMSQIQGWFLLAVCIFCFITTLYITNHYYYTWSNFFGIKLLGALSCLITVMVVGAMLLFLAQKHFLIHLCAILYLFFINIFSFSPAFGNFISYDAFALTAFRKPLKSNYSIFNTTIALSKKLDQIDPSRICHIWYNESEFLGPLFRQVNATNYLNCGDKRINKQFPLLQDFSGPIGSEGHFPQSGNEILIITEIGDNLSEAEKNLALFSFKIINSETTLINLDSGNTVFVFKISIR